MNIKTVHLPWYIHTLTVCRLGTKCHIMNCIKARRLKKVFSASVSASDCDKSLALVAIVTQAGASRLRAHFLCNNFGYSTKKLPGFCESFS